MSQRPIDRSPDLKRLRDEGYDLQVVGGGHLIVRSVPYLAEKGALRRDGILICVLPMAYNVATAPPDHTAYFIGAHPCHEDGSLMTQVVNSPNKTKINDELTTDFYLSAKPKPRDNYSNFYEKVTTYVRLFSRPAQELDPEATAQTYSLVRDDEEEAIFHYYDTATSRAEIVEVNQKMRLNKVAILGLGGTGGYILDLVAKAPIREIHLFDGDRFLQHNAFRAPGAASGAELEPQPHNALHAALVVIKFKKLFGFYADQSSEHYSTYAIGRNDTNNEDAA